MTHSELHQLRIQLSAKAKNGIDFLLAAAIVWSIIAYIWMLDAVPYNKSVFTFIIGALLLPLAFLFSKIFQTQWKIPDNPLQPLGLILNFAQLFYFPFLIFLILKQPEYFLMGYIIITGAHFFPYFWFYKQIAYAIFAPIISVGGTLLALNLTTSNMYLAAVFTVCCLLAMVVWLYFTAQKSKQILSSST